MILRTPTRMPAKTSAAALSAVIIAASTAGMALAGTFSGNGTIVGTSTADTITAGSGNDTVWGLGGADVIKAGNGNDVIDGDGHCDAGVAPGVYPHGLPAGDYCEHGPIAGDGGDSITVGGGNDTVYGGGGHNTITVGNGDDTIIGGPLGDTTIAGTSTGQGNDQIYLGSGHGYTGSTVTTGAGDDVVHAQNGVKDTITCASGNGTTVYADRSDVVKHCAHVIYTPDPNPTFRSLKSALTHRAARRNAHKAKHHRRHH